MSTEAIYEELINLRQRTEQLEKAFSSASRSVKQQYRLWINSQRAGETLRELRHRLSFMMQRHPLGVILWNMAFEVTDWNPAAEKIFGYSQREALGRHVAELLIPESAKQNIHEVFTAFLQQKQVVPSTNDNCTKDGKIITCKWHNTPLTDLHGNIIGLMSIVEDITVSPEMEFASIRHEAHYKKVIANVPAMIYQFQLEADGTASFVYILSGCEQFYGIEPEKAQQYPRLFTDAVHPGDRQDFLESIAISAQTLQTWNWEGRILSACGQWKWVQAISQPEEQQTGKILWDGLLIDVSAKKAEASRQLQQEIGDIWQQATPHFYQKPDKQIQATQQFINSIIDNMPVAIFVKDAVDLCLVFCNCAAENLIGLSTEDIIGKNEYELFSKEEADLLTNRDWEAINSQKVIEITEEIIPNRKGENRILHTKKTPIIDSEGKPKYLLVVREDITQHRRAEAALAESEAKFRSLVENANDVIYSLSLDGFFTYLSPNFTDIFGYDICEYLGRSFVPIIHPDDVSACMSFFNNIAEIGNKQAGLQVRVKRQDGSYCWIVSNTSPVKDADGKVVGFQGITRDITVWKSTEEALQKSETQLRQQAFELEQNLQEYQRIQSQLIQSEKMSSIGQLVAGVAHEINNPVNFIYGNLLHANQYTHDLLNFLSLYQKNYPNPVPEIQEEAEAIDLDFLLQDLPHLLSSMKIGADRIRQIVASLRTFSRFDEADLRLANIHEGIDSTLMILDHRLKEQSHRPKITVIKEYGDIPLIECYAGQLNQVFMNILANAIDALEESYELQSSPDSCLTIHIFTEIPNPQQLIIRIADNGPGMSEEVLKRLFDPFYTTKPVGKGTGMGLSISYQIVTERHNGSLQCISSLGKGAEFVIAIPIQSAET